MRQLSVLVAVAVFGLIGLACGDSDESSSSGPTAGEAPPSTAADSAVEDVLPSTAFAADEGPSSANTASWVEEDVSFSYRSDELHGVLSVPIGDGPHPAIVLVTGSASPSTGLLDGASSPALTGYANDLVRGGYAVLRYDPVGVGRSTGVATVETMDARASEAIAALHYLQARPDIQADHVGLWGESQGGWVISLAAAEQPMNVAFIISVSGAGISVADQQIWGIENQSRAAGLDDIDVAKAALFGRLLVDWQLSDPIYREASESSLAILGVGPWTDFYDIVYGADDGASFQDLDEVVGILEGVQDEPWADALFLTELYLPRLRGATSEQVAAMRDAIDDSLMTDPRDYLTRVTCPVLAFFGEDDVVQPSETSARLFEDYLATAGNQDVTIVMLPDVGHDIDWTTPGYSDMVLAWLRSHDRS